MSKISNLALGTLGKVNTMTANARRSVRIACMDADALLAQMAEDKQCDSEDVVTIVQVREKIERLRKEHS